MPKNAVQQCKRGHPLTPENTETRRDGYRNCRACHRAAKVRHGNSARGRAAKARYDLSDKGKARDVRYAASPLGRETRSRYGTRYEATVERWAAHRERKLGLQREAIQARLAALEKEEEECLRSLGKAIVKK
jgi:hypothetical protein